MKAGVVVLANPKSGGAYRYEMGVIRGLQRSSNLDFVVFVPKRCKRQYQAEFPRSETQTYKYSKTTLFGLWLRSSILGFHILTKLNLRYSQLEKSVLAAGCNLIYFLSPNPLALGIVDLPLISTVWDLGHREIPVYPEISGNRHFEEREHYFSSVLPKSTAIIVDSESTRQNLKNYYAIDEEKVLVGGMPFELNSEELSEVLAFDTTKVVSNPYLIYPAHFWPHKRHILLLKAFSQIARRFPDLTLVLTGSNKGNAGFVKETAMELGISNRVLFTGFLPYTNVLALIRNAELLVFPSDLGPTNIPPLEARFFGTPSVLSKVHDTQIHSAPTVSFVPEQSAQQWCDAICDALNKKQRDNRTIVPAEPHRSSLLSDELVAFLKSKINEWRSPQFYRIDD